MKQGAFRSTLNDRPVGHRIGERHAQFNQRRASRGQFNDQIMSCFEIRIAGRDEGNETATLVAFEERKGFGDA